MEKKRYLIFCKRPNTNLLKRTSSNRVCRVPLEQTAWGIFIITPITSSNVDVKTMPPGHEDIFPSKSPNDLKKIK